MSTLFSQFDGKDTQPLYSSNQKKLKSDTLLAWQAHILRRIPQMN
jgi:hypothetical protein